MLLKSYSYYAWNEMSQCCEISPIHKPVMKCQVIYFGNDWVLLKLSHDADKFLLRWKNPGRQITITAVTYYGHN